MKGNSPDSNQPFPPQLKGTIGSTSSHLPVEWEDQLECDRGGLQSYTATQVVLRSRSGWWFASAAETTWRSQWWASYPTVGWYSLLAVFIRDTLSVETSCSPQTWPISVQGSAKNGAEPLLKLSIDLFNPKIQKKWSLIPRSGKKHHLSHRFQTGEKVIDTCRNIAIRRDSLRQSYSRVTPTPSSGIEPEKSVQKIKARKATRDCKPSVVPWFVNWSARCPKTNQSLCPNPVGCLEHPASKQNR